MKSEHNPTDARRGPSPATPATAAESLAACFDAVFIHAFSSSTHLRCSRIDPIMPGEFFFIGMKLNTDAVARYATCGVRPSALDEWFKVSRLPRRQDLFGALCLNASTLSRARRSSAQELDAVVTERMFRQSDLMVRAAEVFGDDGPTWMTKPHPLLDGKTPAEFATNEYGGEKVRSILAAIQYGGVV